MKTFMIKITITILMLFLFTNVFARDDLLSTKNGPIDVPNINYGDYIVLPYSKDFTYNTAVITDTGTSISYPQETYTEEFFNKLVSIYKICNFESQFSFLIKKDKDKGEDLNYVINENINNLTKHEYPFEAIVNLQRIIRDTYRLSLDEKDLMIHTFAFCMDLNEISKL